MKYTFPVQFGLIAGVALIGAGIFIFGINRTAPCRNFSEGKVTIVNAEDTTDERNFSEGQITVENASFNIDVASTTAEQARGLGGCRGLAEDTGMYFPYNPPATTPIWMKGMVIPIDIVWIADGKVIAIHDHVPPPGNTKAELLPKYNPPQPVNGVLEIGAGQAQAHNITVGSPVTVTIPDSN